jgi:N-acetylglucosaminyldiphosphoundecaprenol N-acetyl-beta-D-mannosaminyltransferase
MLGKQIILDVGITNNKKEEILEYVIRSVKKSTEKTVIVTPNPEILVYAAKCHHYKTILNNADIALPDGIGIMWAGRILGIPLVERITGTDFMELLCKHSQDNAVNIGFLGGKPGVAERAIDCLRRKYPKMQVKFVGDDLQLLEKGQSDQPIDILFVALGHPRQEEWISAHIKTLPVKVAMGVGGAFDYISGDVSRAPKIVRTLGFEWLYRLIRQPWRWKRQLALIEFIFLVVKRRLKY